MGKYPQIHPTSESFVSKYFNFSQVFFCKYLANIPISLNTLPLWGKTCPDQVKKINHMVAGYNFTPLLGQNIFLQCFWRTLLKHGDNMIRYLKILSYQPRVTVTSFFVYKAIRDLYSIDLSCINPNYPFHRIGLIHK